MKIRKNKSSFFTQNRLPMLGLIVAALLFVLSFPSVSHADNNEKPIGVFLGLHADEISRLDPYQTVVLEPTTFTKEQIEELHKKGKIVFGYFNVGSLENWRPYASRFDHLTLGAYENWPEEKWIDVSQKQWQDFLINELAPSYRELGIDGFFIDNADVYYKYPREEIYHGIESILLRLRETKMPIMINGGDVFVKRALKEGTAASLFDGASQESVFTTIDFSSKTYKKQSERATAYFLKYLSRLQEANLKVWLIEYGADASLVETISNYCNEQGFLWYNTESFHLR